jgi:Ca2+-binding EF-hand superfamily protein
MKFVAIAALIATASAVRLSAVSKQGAPSWEDVLEVLDEDNNGKVSWPEIEAFIKEMEQQYGEKMPKDMKKEIKNMFDMVDTDGSGEIDKAEFEAAVAAHGALGQKTRTGFSQLLARQGAPSWEDVLEVLDEDNNGKVSWPEIEAFIKEMEQQYGEKMPKDMKKEIKNMFDMVDTDGSGEIDKAEFEAAVAAHGALGQKTRRSFKKLVQMKAKQGAPSWEDVLSVLDTDGSKTVSWEEIVAFIKQIEKEHGVKISQKDKQAIKAAFEQVDADGSGDIDKKEFEAAVAAMEGLAQLKKYM